MSGIKEFFISLIVNYILDQIKNGGVGRLADRVQALVVPAVRGWKVEIIERMKSQAEATDGKLDDTIVQAVDIFLEALIPDCSACKPVVPK